VHLEDPALVRGQEVHREPPDLSLLFRGDARQRLLGPVFLAGRIVEVEDRGARGEPLLARGVALLRLAPADLLGEGVPHENQEQAAGAPMKTAKE